jgi:RNA polymerase sigma-70 factor (ECF subfamily)
MMPMVQLTPERQSTLAERLRSHEPAAEEELVRQFSKRVAVLVLARTRDREAARDLTQEVMLAVVLALRNGHLRETERLAAFVYGTARNVINNYLRSRNRVPRAESIDTAPDVASTPDPVERRERVALGRRVLRNLETIDRTILLLTLVEGLKPAEIAVRLGLTPEVVRSRKSRAVRKLTERVLDNVLPAPI